jgi:hypothetical protein
MHDVDRDREKRARDAVQATRQKLPWLFSREGNENFYRAHMEAADDEVLAELACAGEKMALEILRKRVRFLCEGADREGRDVILHPRVVMLAVEVFSYGPPKTLPGSKPTRTSARNTAIALLVKIVHEDYGFPLYVQPEHRGDRAAPMTAHRLVGEELCLNERAIERIWRDRKDMVTRRR